MFGNVLEILYLTHSPWATFVSQFIEPCNTSLFGHWLKKKKMNIKNSGQDQKDFVTALIVALLYCNINLPGTGFNCFSEYVIIF